jgi:hypothetical protein
MMFDSAKWLISTPLSLLSILANERLFIPVRGHTNGGLSPRYLTGSAGNAGNSAGNSAGNTGRRRPWKRTIITGNRRQRRQQQAAAELDIWPRQLIHRFRVSMPENIARVLQALFQISRNQLERIENRTKQYIPYSKRRVKVKRDYETKCAARHTGSGELVSSGVE